MMTLGKGTHQNTTNPASGFTGSLPASPTVFLDSEKLKKWILFFLLILGVYICLDLMKVFSGNIGHFMIFCSLFLIFFSFTNLRVACPNHFTGVVSTSLVMLGFSAYFIFDRRYDFETEKLTTGLLMVGLVFIGACFKLKKKLSFFVALGSAKNWMFFHIYSGIICLFILLVHVEFKPPVGFFSNLLFYLFLFFTFLGTVGLYLQKVIPIELADLEVEVIYEKIPKIIDQLKDGITALLDQQKERRNISETLSSFCDQEVLPFFQATFPRMQYLFSTSAGLLEKHHKFDKIALFLNDEEKRVLSKIRGIYIEKQQLDVHRSLQWMMRQWLWFHIVSAALIIILITYHISLMFFY